MNVKIADRIKSGVIIVTALIMGYVLFISRDHITHVAHLIRLSGYQADTLFVFIDLPAAVGRTLMLKYFAASTRRLGFKLMMVTGTISLACNVTSGVFSGGYGPAGYGAFIVLLFVGLEHVITKIKPAASVTRAKNSGNAVKTQPTKRQLAARKGAATRRRNAAAPVSPGAPAVLAPSVAFMEAMAD